MYSSLRAFDKLTALPTRHDFMKDLKSIDAHDKHACTLINIQIDDFDDISEYFGMDVSNEIIFQVANFLKNSLPTRSAKLYRFEMDKFMIFVSSRTSLIDIDNYTKDLIQAIRRKSFLALGNLYSISTSVGVARGRTNLFRRSYLALNDAKSRESSYVIYNHKSNIEEKFLKNIQMHQIIKDAIENDKIVAFFQPIANTKTKRIEKYEALIRIRNDDGTYKSPVEFLDIAKKVKLYTKLTKKMVSLAISRIEFTRKPVTINITMDDIENLSISRYIYNSVLKSDLGKFITFELVESEEIKSFIKVSNFIKKLKILGCKFAIDDFGSGYSNFENILKLDFDYIKIDGSLIKNIDKSYQNELFVKTIVNMAKELNIQTIAEYVYNKSVYKKINELGIDFVQGNYIGKARGFIA